MCQASRWAVIFVEFHRQPALESLHAGVEYIRREGPRIGLVASFRPARQCVAPCIRCPGRDSCRPLRVDNATSALLLADRETLLRPVNLPPVQRPPPNQTQFVFAYITNIAGLLAFVSARLSKVDGAASLAVHTTSTMHACRITFEAGRHLDLLLTRMAHTNLTGILCTSNLWSGGPSIGGRGGKIARVQTAYLEHRANCGANYLGRVFENLGPMSPLCPTSTRLLAGPATPHHTTWRLFDWSPTLPNDFDTSRDAEVVFRPLPEGTII